MKTKPVFSLPSALLCPAAASCLTLGLLATPSTAQASWLSHHLDAVSKPITAPVKVAVPIVTSTVKTAAKTTSKAAQITANVAVATALPSKNTPAALGKAAKDSAQLVASNAKDTAAIASHAVKDSGKAFNDVTHEAREDVQQSVVEPTRSIGQVISKAAADAGRGIKENLDKAGRWVSRQIGLAGLEEKARNLMDGIQKEFNNFMKILGNLGSFGPVLGISFMVLTFMFAFLLAGKAVVAWGLPPRKTLLAVAMAAAAVWVLGLAGKPASQISPGPAATAAGKPLPAHPKAPVPAKKVAMARDGRLPALAARRA